MKVHKLIRTPNPNGKMISFMFCGSNRFNARFQSQATENWDEVTCKRCKPSLKGG